jgi:signal transduction histidine kinase
VEQSEISKLSEIGFRGKNATLLTTNGTGQGLSLMKTICDYHDARITFSSDGSSYNLNDIIYCTFTVHIYIKKG